MEEVEVELTEQAKEEIEVIGKNLKEIESLITEPAEDVPNVFEDNTEKPEAEVSEEPTKETFIYETEPFERIFEFDLSKEDKANLFEEFLEIENKIEAEEQRLKAYKATAKATIEDLEGEKEAIANQYRKGKSTRTVKAFWRMNYPEPGTKTLFKVCDGVDDPILSEEMDNSDRQMTFKMWQKATGQVEETEKSEEDSEERVEEGNVVPQSIEPEDDDEEDED